MQTIFNLISIFPFYIYLISIVELNNKKYNLLISILIGSCIEKLVKKLTKGINFLKRPKDATDCNCINTGGLVENNPGFPSGHVTVTSIFMHYLWFTSNDTNYINYLLPIIIMSIARIGKKCHNVYQVLGGYLLGYVISLYMFKKNI